MINKVKIKPKTHLPAKPLPKPLVPKKIRKIKALPRRQTPDEQAPATPAKPATEPASLPKRLQEKVKNLFNEIIPYYIPEPIKRLKFIPEAISNFTTKIIPEAISNFFSLKLKLNLKRLVFLNLKRLVFLNVVKH